MTVELDDSADTQNSATETFTIRVANVWIGGNGVWDNPANWSSNQVPGSTDDVMITGNPTIIGPTEACSINSLCCTGTLDLSDCMSTLRPSGSIFNITDGLTGNGTITNGGSLPATLTIGVSSALSAFGGTIRDGSGTLALVKTGAGVLTLSGTNTYSGDTTINQGTLQLGTSSALSGSTNVTVDGTTDGSATLDIGANTLTVAGVHLLGGGSIVGTGMLTSDSDYDVQWGSISAP